MKALIISTPGSVEDLHFGDLPDVMPGPGEVLIDLYAASVNPADWKIVQMGLPSWTLPMAAGLDGAGRVSALGEGVTDWQIGDRVLFHSSFLKLGTFAEQVVAPQHVLSRIPEEVSFVQAAALPTASFTAFQVIEERLQPGPDDTILIHAAAGGVGGAAVQLARARGATIIGTCSAANADYVTRLGADHTIDYKSENVGERISELTEGRGVDAIFNTLTPQTGADAIPLLAFQGHLATVVGLPDFTKLDALPRGIRLSDVALGAAYLSGDLRAQQHLRFYGDALMALVAAKKFDPMVEVKMPFTDARQALERNMTGRQRGKIVLEMRT